MDGGAIYPDDGVGEIKRPFGWSEYVDATTQDASLIMLTDNLASSPWVAEALEHPENASVDCTKQGHVLAVRVRGHKRRVSVLVDRASWDKKLHPMDLLRALGELFTYHGSGPQTTPGALGGWGMAYQYGRSGMMPRSRPSLFMRKAMLDHATGGLVATPGKGQSFARLWEIDRRSAYPAEARAGLPVDTPIRLLPSGNCPARDYPLWYCRCLVNLKAALPLPLIGAPAGKGLVWRPRVAGHYGDNGQIPLWLWSVEAAALEELGYGHVTPLHGWAWDRAEHPLEGWANWIWSLRQQAPSQEIASWTKLAAAAGVGRLGMHPVRYRLARAIDQPEGEPVVRNAWPPITDYVVSRVPDFDSPSPVDWNSLILARARVNLWRRALAEITAGAHVYSLDHDAIVMDQPSAFPLFPETLGDWKQTELHHVSIPEARQLVSDEVTRLPGVPTSQRVATAIHKYDDMELANSIPK